MRALSLHAPGNLVLADVAEPDRADGHALVRVQRAGICGTDMKILSGTIPVAPRRILGHEIVGTVVAGGDRAVADGARVLIDPSVSCGRCTVCRADRPQLCPHGGLLGRDLDGGFADLVSVPLTCLHPLPADLADDHAVLLQVLGTCVHAQQRIRVFPGDSAVVLGLGVSGLMHVQLLRERGAKPIITATRSEFKRDLARRLGADISVPPDQLEKAVSGLPRSGADVVVECAGSQEAMRLAMMCAGYGGSVLVFGTTSPVADAVPTYRLYHREVDVVNSRAAQPRDYEAAISLAASTAVDLGALLTARFPLEAQRAAVTSCGDPAQLKVIFEVAAAS